MRYLIGVSLVLVLAAGCSGSSGSPTTPAAGGSSSGQTCRNYPTAYTSVTVSSASVATVTSSASYNTSTFQLTTPFTFADNQGTAYTAVFVFSYSSTADFVDEVSVIPPLTRWTGLSMTSTGSFGTISSAQTNSFDAQKRWTRNVSTTPGAASLTTTYTAWDSVGRPTAGSLSTEAGLTTIAVSYNDGARTQTQTSSTIGFPTYVGVTTYDANGNLVQTVATTNGATVATTTATIASTGRVCK